MMAFYAVNYSSRPWIYKWSGALQLTGPEAMVIIEARKHFQQRAIEWWSAGMMTSWGFIVLLYPIMFLSQSGFSGLLAIAPQQVWGVVAVISGFLRILGLTVNGFWRRSPLLRWGTSTIAVLVWFLVTVGIYNGRAVTTGIVVYLWHMIADMYCSFRSASDYVQALGAEQVIKEQVGGQANANSRNLRSV